MSDDDITQAARQVIVDYGGDHDETIHRSWRCFDKNRYPEPCDCLDEIAGDLVAAVRPLIEAQTLNDAADALDPNLAPDDEWDTDEWVVHWLRARGAGAAGQHTDTPPATDHHERCPRDLALCPHQVCPCTYCPTCGAGTPEATDG